MKTPRHTTHVRLNAKNGKTSKVAVMSVKDMDCLAGSPGKVTFLQQLHGNQFKELGSFEFDGKWPIGKDKDEK